MLHDKIAGRGAAALIARIGIRHCCIDILSSLAIDILEKHSIQYFYHTRVPKITCRTEDLITGTMTLDETYSMIIRRAGLIHGASLHIENINVSYGTQRVLSNLSLSLAAGEQLVITGDNGSGKTTLLKAIIGALSPDSGTITLHPPENDSVHETRIPRIGYLHQSSESSPFPISTEEIVGMGLAGQRIFGEKARYRIEIAMRRTGCFHLIGRNYFSLSGGEKQRVSLSRCLCQKAGLILMDEPTSFLDTASKSDFLSVLQTVIDQHAPTILLVSHDHEWTEKLGWPVKNMEDGALC